MMQAFDIPGALATLPYPTAIVWMCVCARECVCSRQALPGSHIPGNPAPTRVGRPDLRVASPPPSRLGTCSNTTDIPFRCWNPVLLFLLPARRAYYLCWCRPGSMGKREGLRAVGPASLPRSHCVITAYCSLLRSRAQSSPERESGPEPGPGADPGPVAGPDPDARDS
jgi:hypothetical protein